MAKKELTDLPLLTGALLGTELLYIVSPGDVQNGNSYGITTASIFKTIGALPNVPFADPLYTYVPVFNAQTGIVYNATVSQLMLPSGNMPVGGSTGQILAKQSNANFDAAWVNNDTGTVTSVSSGNLAPLFTTSVATATTTPALSFALSNANANTWFGNNTGGTAAPAHNSSGSVTKTDDTNVTLTLGGTPNNSVLNSFSLALGWTGTLAAARGGTGVAALGNLTKTDDTNVTLSLSGTPTGALIQSVGLTLGWTGTLAVARGGSGRGTATEYAVICGGTTATGAHQSVASVGTANQVLTSNGAGALPTFQTLPAVALTVASTAISAGTTTRVLYDNAGVLGEYAISGTGSVAMTNSPTLVTPALGTPSSGNLSSCTNYPVAQLSGLGSGVATMLASATGATVALSWIIDGGGTTITTGLKYGLKIPFACTITAWTIGLDQSGSIVIALWKDTQANYPPVVGDEISAASRPTVSAATTATGTPSGWTTVNVAAGDWIFFNVNSVTSATWANITLMAVKT